MSIDSQLAEMRALAANEGLNVVCELQEPLIEKQVKKIHVTQSYKQRSIDTTRSLKIFFVNMESNGRQQLRSLSIQDIYCEAVVRQRKPRLPTESRIR